MTKATIFTTTGWVGAAAIVVALASELSPNLATIGSVAGLVAFLGCWVLLSTHKADEFTHAIFSNATNLAFTWLLLSMVLLPFAEGFYDGLTGEDAEPEVNLAGFIASAIVAFYVGFVWKRVRGG